MRVSNPSAQGPPSIIAIPTFQQHCDVDQADSAIVSLGYHDISGGGLVTTAEQANARVYITRIRAGVGTTIVGGAVLTESDDGYAYYTYTFPAASWQIGDIVAYILYNAQVTRGGKTFKFAYYFGWGWITS